MGSNEHLSVEVTSPAGRTLKVHKDAVEEYLAKGWTKPGKARKVPKPEPEPPAEPDPETKDDD